MYKVFNEGESSSSCTSKKLQVIKWEKIYSKLPQHLHSLFFAYNIVVPLCACVFFAQCLRFFLRILILWIFWHTNEVEDTRSKTLLDSRLQRNVAFNWLVFFCEDRVLSELTMSTDKNIYVFISRRGKMRKTIMISELLARFFEILWSWLSFWLRLVSKKRSKVFIILVHRSVVNS